MKKTAIFKELIGHSWKNHKFLLFVIMFESIFSSVLSLINVVGIGVVTDALINGSGNEQIIKTISCLPL